MPSFVLNVVCWNQTRNANKTATTTSAAETFSEWHTFYSFSFLTLTQLTVCDFRMFIVAFACPLQWFSDIVLLILRFVRKKLVHTNWLRFGIKSSALIKNKATHIHTPYWLCWCASWERVCLWARPLGITTVESERQTRKWPRERSSTKCRQQQQRQTTLM